MKKEETTSNTYTFLQPYVNKIVVVAAKDSVIKAQWQKKRTSYLLTEEKLQNLSANNYNLREVLPNEVILEFDQVDATATLEEVQQESNKWIDKIQKVLVKEKKSFTRTSHGGKSDHIRFFIDDLNYQPDRIINEVKKIIADRFLEQIEFESDIIELDHSLLVHGLKLLPIEEKPHWKKDYNGAIEKVIVSNSGSNLRLPRKILEEIDTKLQDSLKHDVNSYTNYGKFDTDEKALANWLEKYFVKGNRNSCFLALCGFSKRIGYSVTNFEKLFYRSLELNSQEQYFPEYKYRINYTYERSKESVAVMQFLKHITDEPIKCLDELKMAFPQESKDDLYVSSDFKSWGLVDTDANLLLEQLENHVYVCNHNGKLEVIAGEHYKGKNGYLLKLSVAGETLVRRHDFSFSKQYYTPTVKEIEQFIAEGKIITTDEILHEVRKILQVTMDFANPNDVNKWVLYILQTYLAPFLDAFFFMAIDASKGAGKTTLLENAALLARHGYFAGDTSAASLYRLCDEFDLVLLLDEIDQNSKNKDDDIINALRKGQRRNNSFTRYNNSTSRVESFDMANPHAICYRSEAEDAFIDRCLMTHGSKSSDSRLSPINLYKQQILQPIAKKLWFWYISNFDTFNQRAKKLQKKVQLSDADITQLTPDDIRKKTYATITEGFSEIELRELEKHYGRNSEICYLQLFVYKILEIDMLDIVSANMGDKKDDDELNKTVHQDVLEGVLRDIYDDKVSVGQIAGASFYLHEGKNYGCYFATKTEVYMKYNLRLKNSNLAQTSAKVFTGLLRDIGFIDKINMCNQRPPDANPTKCLIFDKKILQNTGKNYNPKEILLQELQEKNEVNVEDFTERHPNSNDMITKLKTEGEIWEYKPGWIKIAGT